MVGMKLMDPTKDQLDTICNEFNITEKQLKEDTKTLKNWIKSQPHLPHDIDDTIVTSFLVGCKNSLERSKQTLDKYLSNRTSCPEFYSNRDPLDPFSRKLAKLVQFFPLPAMTQEGYRVSINRVAIPDMNPADFSLRVHAIQLLSTYDVRFQEENYWAGEINIVDCQNITFKLVQAAMNIAIFKKYTGCVIDSLPVRFKKVIFINMSGVIEPILALIKKFTKDKLVQRIITTTEDHTFLYKHVPREILPDEYGGQAGKLDDLNDSWQLKVESYREWFLKDMTRKVDETKRPETSKRYKNDFGVEGSFKTLTID